MMVGVAHLARAPGCGPGGGGFDPLRSPHKRKKENAMHSPFCVYRGSRRGNNAPRERSEQWSDHSLSECVGEQAVRLAFGSIPFVFDHQYTSREVPASHSPFCVYRGSSPNYNSTKTRGKASGFLHSGISLSTLNSNRMIPLVLYVCRVKFILIAIIFRLFPAEPYRIYIRIL